MMITLCTLYIIWQFCKTNYVDVAERTASFAVGAFEAAPAISTVIFVFIGCLMIAVALGSYFLGKWLARKFPLIMMADVLFVRFLYLVCTKKHPRSTLWIQAKSWILEKSRK